MTLSSTYEADLTFTDDASSSESTVTTQSGSYNDEGEFSGTSTLTRTLVDDYFSEYQGDSYWESDGIIQVIDFEREAQGETTRTFSSSETYSNEETTASWTSSFETTWSWSTHADILEFGYHTIFNDSDSGTSDNDDSGIYTPNNNPVSFYQDFRPRTLIIMVMSGGEPGVGDSAGPGAEGNTGQEGSNSIAGQIVGAIANGIASGMAALLGALLNGQSVKQGNPKANNVLPPNPAAEIANYEGESREDAFRSGLREGFLRSAAPEAALLRWLSKQLGDPPGLLEAATWREGIIEYATNAISYGYSDEFGVTDTSQYEHEPLWAITKYSWAVTRESALLALSLRAPIAPKGPASGLPSPRPSPNGLPSLSLRRADPLVPNSGKWNRPNVKDSILKDVMDNLWRPQDKRPGGTIGELLREKASGGPLVHLEKAKGRLAQLIKRVQDFLNPLSKSDRAGAERVISDLKEAIRTVQGP